MRIRTSPGDSSDMINISSLLDVMFILIIFFLVTTVFREEEMDHQVQLPVDARNQSLSQSAGNMIKINIRSNGAYVLMGRQVTEEQMQNSMKTAVDKKNDVKVVIRCDKEAKHLYLANIMSICRHVGVSEANIAVKTLQ